jgi:hypothetical protein
MTMADVEDSLEHIQQRFFSALKTPINVMDNSLHSSIKPTSRLNSAQCLAIYQRSYYARLLSCMSEQFPALCYCLGRDVFNDFATKYLTECASNSYTLYELGRRFPQYLQDTRPDKDLSDNQKQTWISFMIDLASFEFEVFSLFDAHGNKESELANLDTPDEDLVLQQCFKLENYQFDVAEYYHSVRHKKDISLPPLSDTTLALVRKDFLTYTLYLSTPHYLFLLSLKEGNTVSKAITDVSSKLNLAREQVVSSWNDPKGLRKRWIESGLFLDRRKVLTL